MGCLALELAGSWVELGLRIGIEALGVGSHLLMIHGVRSSMMVPSSGAVPPVSGFQSPSYKSELLCPHNTKDKTPQLTVKQLSTARNSQSDSQSYTEK